MVAPCSGPQPAKRHRFGEAFSTSIIQKMKALVTFTSAMRWSFALATAFLGLALAAAFGLLGSPVHAQTSTQVGASHTSALVSALNTLRERGCGGSASKGGKAAPFELEPRLSNAAGRIAGGLPLAAALKASSYVAPRSAVISLSGYPSARAFAEGAAQHSCSSLTDPALRALGVHSRGNAVWIVLAEPFEPPKANEAAEVAARVLTLVNTARAQPRQCGDQAMAAAGPLTLHARLNATAQAHAEDMARHSYFSHTGRDGSQVGGRATRAAYVWLQIGENIAAGQMRPEMAVDGWLKSPGHCVNLMRPQYTEMGLAYSVNLASDNSIFWVQVFGEPR